MITKLKTESQNPKQNHKPQNKITKLRPKTETQNSKRKHKTVKQKHKTQKGNTKPKTEIQNR